MINSSKPTLDASNKKTNQSIALGSTAFINMALKNVAINSCKELDIASSGISIPFKGLGGTLDFFERQQKYQAEPKGTQKALVEASINTLLLPSLNVATVVKKVTDPVMNFNQQALETNQHAKEQAMAKILKPGASGLSRALQGLELDRLENEQSSFRSLQAVNASANLVHTIKEAVVKQGSATAIDGQYNLDTFKKELNQGLKPTSINTPSIETTSLSRIPFNNIFTNNYSQLQSNKMSNLIYPILSSQSSQQGLFKSPVKSLLETHVSNRIDAMKQQQPVSTQILLHQLQESEKNINSLNNFTLPKSFK